MINACSDLTWVDPPVCCHAALELGLASNSLCPPVRPQWYEEVTVCVVVYHDLRTEIATLVAPSRIATRGPSTSMRRGSQRARDAETTF